MSKKSVLSCIQPTGELHIGNYFGALKNFVKLQDDYRCVYGVVDLHAMTMPYEPAQLKKNTEQLYVDMMAAGLDPQRSILFVQSLVPEHAELHWIFSCVCSYGDLTRQAQFKDKSDQLGEGEFISAGLFNYPVLQAADILIYRADYVPVGKDQEQHLELSREIVRRFNMRFGDYFPEPAMLATETPKVLSLADPTKKMSKSYGEKHVVGLFADEKEIRARVRSAVTDTGGSNSDQLSAGVENLLGLLVACGKPDIAASFRNDYASGNRKYAPLKDAVSDALVELITPMRERRAAIMKDRDAVKRQMHEGSEQARAIAAETLRDVRKLVGLPKR
jgi:tryptophanyl-tRNA synthetase